MARTTNGGAIQDGTIVLLLVRGGERRVIGRVGPDRPCDLAVVDRLLRVQLVVGRRGWSLRVLDADAGLVELLEVCGVSDALGV